LNEPVNNQAGSDAFGASRKLLSSPDKSKSAVRNALDEAALKLSSVGTTLQDMTPRPLRAAGDDEWTLSTENPVFSEANTPREYSQNTSAKNTPAKKQGNASNVTSPTRSTPRSARTPGSAQKEDANGFPRSFPVKKPAGGYGLQGGLAGWMRKSTKLQDTEDIVFPTSDASSDAGISPPIGGGLGDVLLMILALFLVLGMVFLAPTASLPPSVAVPLTNFRQQAATYTALAPTGTEVVALIKKVPQSFPHFSSTNFPLSDLRYRAASTFRHLSSGISNSNTAVQEYKTTSQIAIDAVQAPLKVVGSAVAGICLAAVMVAAVLQLQGAMPVSTLSAIFGAMSKSSGAAAGAGNGFYNQNNLLDDLIEEEAQPTRSRGRGTATGRKGSSRAAPATPSSTRRLVSDDVGADGGGGGRTSSARKAWRRQATA
jgi:hypothetical protein